VKGGCSQTMCTLSRGRDLSRWDVDIRDGGRWCQCATGCGSGSLDSCKERIIRLKLHLRGSCSNYLTFFSHMTVSIVFGGKFFVAKRASC
jgi:hypothetical protein